ncbi:hypothetical protein Tco_1126142 [Tanacetum coccineum]
MNMLTNLTMQKQNPSGSGSLPSNTVANPRGDVKAITTRSGVAYDGPTIPPNPSPLPKEVECETEATKDKKVALKNLETPTNFSSRVIFRELDECLALANLGASINLMPLSIWKKLSLPELTPTRMTLELANRSVVVPDGVAEDVFVKETFLEDDKSFNRFNVIDVTYEEDAQEVLGFLDSSMSGNPTPSDSIIASSSPSFTPFESGDFILEEIETFLRTSGELSNLDDDYYDTEGDILYLEKLLNEDPSPTLPSMKNDNLKQVDVTMTKPSIKEPPELELKDLPSNLEYAFLEGILKS